MTNFKKSKTYEQLEEAGLIAWRPNEGSQTFLLAASNIVFKGKDDEGNEHSLINYFLYHGSRGIGKSEYVCGDIAPSIGIGYGSYFKAIIFRKTYSELEDIISKAERFFIDSGCFKGATLTRGGKPQLKFATGEVILFRHIASTKDYDKYHGQEYSYIAFEELTLWSNEDIVTMMKSCLRLHQSYNNKYKKDIKDGKKQIMIGKIRATTNPYGAGKDWVKREFINAAPAGQLFVKDGITMMHIKGHFIENKYIDSNYLNNFKSISNEDKRRSWVYGDWDANAGGVFADMFDRETFVMEPFEIPTAWYIDKSMDWGKTAPFSVLWFAEVDNKVPVRLKDGTLKYFPNGTLFIIGEFYGKSKQETRKNVGLRLTQSEVAEGIIKREELLRRDGIVNKHIKIYDGAADNSISSDSKNHKEETTYDIFEKYGISWMQSNKSAGSRVKRVDLMHERMRNTIEQDPDKPHIYIFDTCEFWLENIMALQYCDKNPDDVDTTMEDHDWDATGYRLMHKRPSSKQGSISSFR